jgi:hypothetical protein
MRARPLRFVAFALLAMLCIGAGSQVSTIPLTYDLSSVIGKVVYGSLGLLGAGLLWLGKEALATLKALDGKMTDASAKLTTISHELFGVTGQNGMRSDLKETKRLVRLHSKVLVVLADREGIDYHEDDR